MPTAIVLPGWGTPPARMEAIRTALREAGVVAGTWRYEADGTIHGLGAELAALAADADGPVHLVGHSLGGLVAAGAVLHHGLAAASVTTINSPWRGTWAAWTAHPGDPLGRELRWGSATLAELRTALDEHLDDPDGPRWSVLSAAGDLAVPMTGSTRVPSGPRMTTQLLPVAGHSVSLVHERMVAAVVDRVVGVTV